jgi:hypothetical protein
MNLREMSSSPTENLVLHIEPTNPFQRLPHLALLLRTFRRREPICFKPRILCPRSQRRLRDTKITTHLSLRDSRLNKAYCVSFEFLTVFRWYGQHPSSTTQPVMQVTD